jgi:hypothetical protein
MALGSKRGIAMMASGISASKKGYGVRSVGVKRTPGAPTMHLITKANCEVLEEKFGIPPLSVSCAMETPIEHAEYELTELPTFVPSGRTVHRMPWECDDEQYKKFRASLPSLTPEALYEVMAPQGDCDMPQRSTEWYTARSFRVTGSQFASAAHENPSMSAAKLLEAKVYPSRNPFDGNAYTEWGSLHEVHAEDAFLQFLTKHLGSLVRGDGEKYAKPDRLVTRLGSQDFTFEDGSCLEHPGLLSTKDTRWLGFSPDALLWNKDRTEVELIEYKCPAYQRSGPGHPYAAKNSICVPRQYMPQIQGSMHLLRERFPGVRCVRSWFVVWQAHQFFVTHVPYVPQYAERTVAAGTSFFHERFLPACVDAIKQRDEK